MEGTYVRKYAGIINDNDIYWRELVVCIRNEGIRTVLKYEAMATHWGGGVGGRGETGKLRIMVYSLVEIEMRGQGQGRDPEGLEKNGRRDQHCMVYCENCRSKDAVEEIRTLMPCS